ncbi:MAG TPA: redoxin domain-containing protein [Candidatus Nanoarchaeia archaeon]|nr:redoxin domain-containing protein [Candidatus Nanoarchaeia archaeon]
MNRNITLGIVIALIIGIIAVIELQKQNSDGTEITIDKNTPEYQLKASQYPRAKELVGIEGYINTDGRNIKIQDYIGKKVILLDIWTYTCINCQRTLPYITSWYEKYKDDGLIIIGIHTPEFQFEKKIENVQNAVSQFNINYPVVLDNNFATWNAYENSYWPRKYLIDIDGFIVYDHVGEGGYKETEQKIQELLKERMERLNEDKQLDESLTEIESETNAARSPETYFGAWRNNNFGNGKQNAVGTQTLELPKQIQPNTLYLSGTWDIQQQYAKTTQKSDAIVFYYNAKKIFMVARADEPVNLKVFIDGQIPKNPGKDVINGTATIKEDRLYELMNDTEASPHIIELAAEDGGLEVFTFTFG